MKTFLEVVSLSIVLMGIAFLMIGLLTIMIMAILSPNEFIEWLSMI